MVSYSIGIRPTLFLRTKEVRREIETSSRIHHLGTDDRYYHLLLVLFVWFFLVRTVIQGNYWFTENGVILELKIENPLPSEILKTNRNVYTDSVINVRVGN